MGEIERMDAFSLVVANMKKGNKATTQRLLEIILKSIRAENDAFKKSSSIRIEKAEDVELFGDLLAKVAE